MKINLDGRNIEVTVWQKDDDEYMYYIGSKLIGSLKTSAMKDENIILKPNTIVSSLEKLGVRIKNENELQNTLENELSAQIKDQINQLDREEIEKEAKQTDQIDKYIEEQGIERSRIRDVVILEWNREKEEKAEKKEELEEKEKKIKHQRNNYNLVRGKHQQQKATEKDVNIYQEVDLDERANDIDTLRNWIGTNIPKNIEKIGVIDSDDRNQMKDKTGKEYKRNSTRYSLIAISKDGTVEPLEKYVPNLRQRGESGNNPTEQKWQVRDDGTVEKDSVFSEYEIGNKIIQIDAKEMGRVELNIGQESATSRETIGVQMRDSNTIFVTDVENRAVIGKYESNGMYTVDRGLDEVEQHERLRKEGKCNEKITRDDIDGDMTTASHTHKQAETINDTKVMQIDEAYIKICAKKILENDTISSVYNQQDIEEKLREKLKDKQELSKENLTEELENIEQEIEEQSEDQRVIGDVP